MEVYGKREAIRSEVEIAVQTHGLVKWAGATLRAVMAPMGVGMKKDKVETTQRMVTAFEGKIRHGIAAHVQSGMQRGIMAGIEVTAELLAKAHKEGQRERLEGKAGTGEGLTAEEVKALQQLRAEDYRALNAAKEKGEALSASEMERLGGYERERARALEAEERRMQGVVDAIRADAAGVTGEAIARERSEAAARAAALRPAVARGTMPDSLGAIEALKAERTSLEDSSNSSIIGRGGSLSIVGAGATATSSLPSLARSGVVIGPPVLSAGATGIAVMLGMDYYSQKREVELAMDGWRRGDASLLPDMVWSQPAAREMMERQMGYPFGRPELAPSAVASLESPLPTRGTLGCEGLTLPESRLPEPIITPMPAVARLQPMVTPVHPTVSVRELRERFERPPVVSGSMDGFTVHPSVSRGPVTLTADDASRRVFNVKKQESPVWRGFKNHKNELKTNGETGSKRRFYEWDPAHNDIEVYGPGGRIHLGSMDPITGEIYKPGVPGRTIKDKV